MQMSWWMSKTETKTTEKKLNKNDDKSMKMTDNVLPTRLQGIKELEFA